jgi:molybdenum cofactor synthesis domain-containing protein
MPTVAALVIGNEILTGKVQETNVNPLARELFARGVDLRRVVMCRDDVACIAHELDELRRSHDWVITSGGVGPTHDDVTLEAVARAFGRRLVRSSQLEDMIRGLVGERLDEGHLRMAVVPEGADLVTSPGVTWPVVLVDNVFVMPGLPKVFRLELPAVCERIGAATPFLSRAVFTLCRETEIASLLDRLVAEHTTVDIGSYPVTDEDYRVRLTFDGIDAEAIDRAVEALLAALPVDKIVVK